MRSFGSSLPCTSLKTSARVRPSLNVAVAGMSHPVAAIYAVSLLLPSAYFYTSSALFFLIVLFLFGYRHVFPYSDAPARMCAGS